MISFFFLPSRSCLPSCINLLVFFLVDAFKRCFWRIGIKGSWSSITYLSHKDRAVFGTAKYMLDTRSSLSLRNEM